MNYNSGIDTWTNNAVLDFIQERVRDDQHKPIAWILGAGASVSSGIPDGATLAKQWLQEIKRRFDDDSSEISLEHWAATANLHIPDFEYSRYPEFYAALYRLRFAKEREQGQKLLRQLANQAEPGFGYSVLAQILATTKHRLVLTTNFDQLMYKAVTRYTSARVRVVGPYELSMALAQPGVVVGDLYLDPFSDGEHMASMTAAWSKALASLWANYTPVVFGHGGCDGLLPRALMAQPVEEQATLIWTYHQQKPERQVSQCVAACHGVWAQVPDFDLFMLQLNARMELPLLDGDIEQRLQKNVDDYRELVAALQKRIKNEPAEFDHALKKTINQSDGWWYCVLKAQSAETPAKQEALYRQALLRFPDNGQLHGHYAMFLHEVQGNYDEAEHHYLAALNLAPNQLELLSNFATFRWQIRQDGEQAENYYRQALTLAPNHAELNGIMATFLWLARKDYTQAEQLYLRSLQLEPDLTYTLSNYANFLAQVKQDYLQAERYYRRSVAQRVSDATYLNNYALFLQKVLGDDHRAMALLEQAHQLEPNNAQFAGRLAILACNCVHDFDRAEALFRHALAQDGGHFINLTNFARFLVRIRHQYQEAITLYIKALELAPEHVVSLDNLAYLMLVTGLWAEAERYSRRGEKLLGTAANSAPAARFLFYRALSQRALNIEDPMPLICLKQLVNDGFERDDMVLNHVLSSARMIFDAKEVAFWQSLACILSDDDNAIAALDNFKQWTALP